VKSVDKLSSPLCGKPKEQACPPRFLIPVRVRRFVPQKKESTDFTDFSGKPYRKGSLISLSFDAFACFSHSPALTRRALPAYGKEMLPEIEKLLVLQDRDQRIRTLKTELKNAPLERKDLETRLAATAAGAESAKAKLRELEVEKKRLEVEAQGKRDQINRFKTQQMQTRKNEEFQALGNEIAHFEKEISKIEDRELEVMELMEAAKPALAEADRKAAESKSRVASQIADLEAKIATIGEALKTAEAERDALTVGIDEDLLDQYNRLFASKGGNAVVALEHEVCTGCHMKLTTQTLVRVRGAQEITHCEQCGRILYWTV